mgnify:CR=1 FL=1
MARQYDYWLTVLKRTWRGGVVSSFLTPLLYVVPGQLLVEATAVRRGVSPDAPDGLGKVTRTR